MEDLFYLVATIASALAIVASLIIIFIAIKIIQIIRTAQLALTSLATTKIAGGFMTLAPLLITTFIKKRRHRQ
jgi:hypothetical protein